jgi:hypothetical protein
MATARPGHRMVARRIKFKIKIFTGYATIERTGFG